VFGVGCRHLVVVVWRKGRTRFLWKMANSLRLVKQFRGLVGYRLYNESSKTSPLPPAFFPQEEPDTHVVSQLEAGEFLRS
jgi:hypothetical protein